MIVVLYWILEQYIEVDEDYWRFSLRGVEGVEGMWRIEDEEY